ncbi:MAG: serine aminopeptidase domain-containing protein [Acetanaerobacterium sp.]
METVAVQTKGIKKRGVWKKIIIIVAAVSILGGIAVFAAIPPLIMGDVVKGHVPLPVYRASDYGVQASELTLHTDDDLAIAAWEVSPNEPKAMVILLSGIQSPSVTAFFGYARMLRDDGYGALLVEMRAHGDSAGSRIDLGMNEYLDVKAGVAYIQEQERYADVPVVVWGTSMGGATAINAIGELPALDGLISCSAYSSWPDAFCDNMALMGMPSAVTVVQKPFVWLYMGFTYGFDKLKVNPLDEIEKLDGRPALLLHSTQDTQVPYQSFERLTARAGDNTVDTFVREGDHHFIVQDEYFEDPAADTEFAGAVLGFLNTNFKAAQESPPADDLAADEPVVQEDQGSDIEQGEVSLESGAIPSLPAMTAINEQYRDRYLEPLAYLGIFFRSFDASDYSQLGELYDKDGNTLGGNALLFSFEDLTGGEQMQKYWEEYPDGMIPQDIVEGTIMRYFELVPEQVQAILINYIPEQKSYRFLGGRGGGESHVVVVDSRETDDLLELDYEIYGYENGFILGASGTNTIRVEQDGWKYLSNKTTYKRY